MHNKTQKILQKSKEIKGKRTLTGQKRDEIEVAETGKNTLANHPSNNVDPSQLRL